MAHGKLSDQEILESARILDPNEKMLRARFSRPNWKELTAKRCAEREQFTREYPYQALFFRWKRRVRQVFQKISEKFLIYEPPCFR